MRGCVEPLGGLGAPITECVHKAWGVGDCFYFEPMCRVREVGGHLITITSAQRAEPSTPAGEGSQRWGGCAGGPVCPRHTLYPARGADSELAAGAQLQLVP